MKRLWPVLALWCVCSVQAQSLPGDAQTKFRFLINADPQMGPEHTERDDLRVLNELLQQFVAETNRRAASDAADFVVYNGDLVWKPEADALDNFGRIVAQQKAPAVLVHGNHDGVGDAEGFLDLQARLSGHRNLHYSFDYGEWHFVVMAAQETYLTAARQQALLQWLRADLAANSGRPTMLFMHYHILPTGLSQTEFYTYFPMAFKAELLDAITAGGQVKYVFSGHVHNGVKASIKTARVYRGTRFVLSPTPVAGRMFGEEYPEYAMPGSRYDRKGFYLQVDVDGLDVRLTGRKINHPHQVVYPQEWPEFTLQQAPLLVQPEHRLPALDAPLNGEFEQGHRHWLQSHRYHADDHDAFVSEAEDGISRLRFRANYGAWSYEEYMESLQHLRYDPEHAKLQVRLRVPRKALWPGGGYIRLFGYAADGRLLAPMLFHWGDDEDGVLYMHQSWGYHATGTRKNMRWLDDKIHSGQMYAYSVPVRPDRWHLLSIDVNTLIERIAPAEPVATVVLAYGVWGRLNEAGDAFTSGVDVDYFKWQANSTETDGDAVHLDAAAIVQADTALPYRRGAGRKKPPARR